MQDSEQAYQVSEVQGLSQYPLTVVEARRDVPTDRQLPEWRVGCDQNAHATMWNDGYIVGFLVSWQMYKGVHACLILVTRNPETKKVCDSHDSFIDRKDYHKYVLF